MSAPVGHHQTPQLSLLVNVYIIVVGTVCISHIWDCSFCTSKLLTDDFDVRLARIYLFQSRIEFQLLIVEYNLTISIKDFKFNTS